MPKGKGTYGSDVGRPPKQEKEYFGGGVVDARNRSQNMDFGTMYQEGGSVYERNQAKRDKVKNQKEAAKKAADAKNRAKYAPGKEGGNQQKIDKLATKRSKVKKGSMRWVRLQNKINRLSGSKKRYSYGVGVKKEGDVKRDVKGKRVSNKPTPKPEPDVKAKPKSPNIGVQYKGKDFKLKRPKHKVLVEDEERQESYEVDK